MAEQYRVTVWDKKANDPYYVLEYDELETAQFVARSMQRHYIDDWGEHASSTYEVRLHRYEREENAEHL
jgi:hypothetical protein